VSEPAPPPPTAPARRRALWTTAVGLLVLASLTAAGIAQWRARPQIDWRFEPAWLAVSVALLIAFQAGQAELWRRMLVAMDHPLDARRARAIWNLTLIARYFPTSALQAAGRVVLSQRAGVPRAVTAAAFVYELVLSFAVALALAAVFLVRLPSLADQPLRWAVVAVPAGLLLALAPAAFGRVSGVALRRIGAEPLRVTLSGRTVAAFAAGYAMCFVAAGAGLFALTRSLQPVPLSALPLITGAFSVAYVASLVGFLLPAGLGAREAALTVTLAPVLPVAVALAVAVALRLAQMAVEVLLGSITWWLDRRTRSATTSSGPAGGPPGPGPG
jgi:hypothetical protein